MAATVTPRTRSEWSPAFLPSLDYGASCWSNRDAEQSWRSGCDGGNRSASRGRRVGWAGWVGRDGPASEPGERVCAPPGDRRRSRPGLAQGTRATFPRPKLSPVIAVSGLSECTVTISYAARPASFPIPRAIPGSLATVRGNAGRHDFGGEYVRARRAGVAVLFRGQSIFGADRAPSHAGTYAGLFQRVRRTNPTLRRTAVPGASATGARISPSRRRAKRSSCRCSARSKPASRFTAWIQYQIRRRSCEK